MLVITVRVGAGFTLITNSLRHPASLFIVCDSADTSMATVAVYCDSFVDQEQSSNYLEEM